MPAPLHSGVLRKGVFHVIARSDMPGFSVRHIRPKQSPHPSAGFTRLAPHPSLPGDLRSGTGRGQAPEGFRFTQDPWRDDMLREAPRPASIFTAWKYSSTVLVWYQPSRSSPCRMVVAKITAARPCKSATISFMGFPV